MHVILVILPFWQATEINCFKDTVSKQHQTIPVGFALKHLDLKRTTSDWH